MKKVIFCILLSVILIFVVGCNDEDVNQHDLICNYVKNHETILREIVNEIFNSKEIKSLEYISEKDIIDKLPKDIEIDKIYKSDDTYINFSVDEGFTSSSHYYGFYYSLNDEYINKMGVAGEKQEYKNGFKWQIEGNEDIGYVEKILDNFYYYEAHF